MLSCVFFVLAIVAAAGYVIVQSTPETRDRIAAKITKPVPALSMAAACLACCASLRVKPKTVVIGGVAHCRRALCQVDIWCVLFAAAFLAFAAGDALLMVHAHAAASAAGVVAFALGQLLILAALCSPREAGEPRPRLASLSIATAYAAAAFVLCLGGVMLLEAACGGASASAVAALAIYLLVEVAVAFRSVDVMLWALAPPGSWLLVAGAHLFIASDVVVGLRMLCGVPADAAAYYALAMTTYYSAIMLEARGVTKFAISSDYASSQSEDFAI